MNELEQSNSNLTIENTVVQRKIAKSEKDNYLLKSELESTKTGFSKFHQTLYKNKKNLSKIKSYCIPKRIRDCAS